MIFFVIKRKMKNKYICSLNTSPMKKYLLPALLLIAIRSFAQSAKNPGDLQDKIFELKVKTVPPETLHLPFESIKILDDRFDTSILGFRHNLVFGYSKIRLDPTVKEGIESFYNDYYHKNFTPNGKVLLISIKKLWINNAPDQKAKAPGNGVDEVSKQDIYAKFEYYYGAEDSFSPVIRMDTIFHLTPEVNSVFDAKDESKLPFFCFALEKMLENINYDLYLRGIENKKKMSVDGIEKYNAGFMDIPVLKEPVKKGVFATFEEFKNNQPSIISFRKRKLKNKIYELVDEKDNAILHYFAYYDGQNLVINKKGSRIFDGGSFHENYSMFRVNNTFQFFEDDSYSSPSVVVVTSGNYIIPVPTSNSRKVLVPRELDLETGNIY